ncbi:hypothetical protein HPB51_006979 [Rhipicephalus microplus]|uniref:Uncharacterized protein n=1 Tax=Rhipicephalus microplus TaxID=6941 RepID=A0A9J6ERB3_RHIMP|nr:hypothetical protein HPB51_006979 [Rhipicephalus microplus]
MQGSAPYAGKGVQGTPQETEKPMTKNKRVDGRRNTRRRWTRPGPETLVRQGWQLTIQIPISIKTMADDGDENKDRIVGLCHKGICYPTDHDNVTHLSTPVDDTLGDISR